MVNIIKLSDMFLVQIHFQILFYPDKTTLLHHVLFLLDLKSEIVTDLVNFFFLWFHNKTEKIKVKEISIEIFFFKRMFTSRHIHIYLPNPSGWAECETRSIYKWFLADFISEFSFYLEQFSYQD